MSALPPKADMCSATRDIRFGSIADDRIGKLDVLRVACDKCGRDGHYRLDRTRNDTVASDVEMARRGKKLGGSKAAMSRKDELLKLAELFHLQASRTGTPAVKQTLHRMGPILPKRSRPCAGSRR
jgi:hypothetical protein